MVNLTSIPSRISKIIPCLESLRPNIVTLHLPLRWKRFKVGKVNLKHLVGYCNIQMHERDYGPGLKLIGALKFQKSGDMIIVDDDVRYPKTLIRDLTPLPNHALGYRGKILDAPTYIKSSCNYADKDEAVDILTGTWGMGLRAEWFDLDELIEYFEKRKPYSFWCDDIVINEYLDNKGIGRRVVRTSDKPEPLDYHGEDALWNVNKERDYNDILISKWYQ